MKRNAVLFFIVFTALVFIPFIGAESPRGQSLNGSTGLYSIPSGRLGWEGENKAAFDFGYRAIINNDAGITHIPAITAVISEWVEISAAFDFQPDNDGYYCDDLLLGLKVKMPTAKTTAIAVGVNVNILNISDSIRYNSYQPYVAITYPGTIFNMSAETTIVFGKTFYSDGPENNSNIDFGMGFALNLFPDVLGNIVHWVIDFANFGYSDDPWTEGSAINRGVLNTGFRFNLSDIPALSQFKLLIDLAFNDLFDAGYRSFTIGAVMGFSVR